MYSRFLFAGLLVSSFVVVASPSADAQCCHCSQCADQGCNKCCRPNRTLIIIRGSNVGGFPFVGAAPPQGFAVASVPAVMVQQPALAIHPASLVSPAGLSSADIDRIVSAARQPNAASANVAAAGSVCTDPCGDIQQLKRDVKDLTLAVEKITTALERIQMNQNQPTPVK